MNRSVEKLRAWYEIRPGASVYLNEFGFYSLERWRSKGYVSSPEEVPDYDKYLRNLFYLDERADHTIGGLGGCRAPFDPVFETRVLEDRGEYELVQDDAGRHVLCFKGRRSGFMPEYADHPVKDMKTWEESCLWRMNPTSAPRLSEARRLLQEGLSARSEGRFIAQYVVGGYMYLRSLIGPLELLYAFYDQPELIHACMRAWLEVADVFTAEVQKGLAYDKVLFDEDICYKNGSLISHEMFRRFLFPYYEQLLCNMRKRQKQPFVFELATDGFHDGVIDLYGELGLGSLAPFEIAAGCDPVRTAAQYPHLRISGGMDKRVLAGTRDDIDRMLEEVLPPLRKRGGYIPTCDHGVPEEVSFENYVYFRKRLKEYCD